MLSGHSTTLDLLHARTPSWPTLGGVGHEGVRIGSSTTQQVCEKYATRRRQFKRARLNWRVSNPKSSKRSLGWIPFKSRAVRYKAGQVHFAGHKLSLWDSHGLAAFELRSGSFAQDARGRWYLNIQAAATSCSHGRLRQSSLAKATHTH